MDKRVLNINSYYGRGFFYKNLYDAMLDKNVHFDVFTSLPYGTEDIDFDYGAYTRVSKNHSSWGRIFFYPKQKKILKDLLSQYDMRDFALCHSNTLFTNGYVAREIRRLYGIPYITAVRTTDVDVFFKYMIHLRHVGIQILAEASKIIFISANTRDKLFKLYIPDRLKEELMNKSEVLPNGLNPFWLKNKNTPKTYMPGADVRCLQVGTLIRLKNVTGTVKALQLLREKERKYNISLDVVGEPKDKCILRSIKRHDWVRCHPHKTKEELINIYRGSDLFIMPSRPETFGLVYLEAMSQGVPVVYTKGEGFDGYFEDGVIGYRVDADDPEDIARGILTTLDNYDRLSRNCLSEVDAFNWDSIAGSYRDLYEEVIGDKGSADYSV